MLNKPAIEPGGGGRFLSFIREELFDYIDTQYRTQPEDRAFCGFSWGGAFSLSVLFNYPSVRQI